MPYHKPNANQNYYIEMRNTFACDWNLNIFELKLKR